MSILVDFPSKKVTLDDIVNLFKIFCECYEIKLFDSDARRLRINYEEFQQKGTLNYRVATGIKFIIQRSGKDQIRVWANLADYIEVSPKHEERFNNSVLDYFTEKNK